MGGREGGRRGVEGRKRTDKGGGVDGGMGESGKK